MMISKMEFNPGTHLRHSASWPVKSAVVHGWAARRTVWAKGVGKGVGTVREGVYQRQSLPISKFSLDLIMPQI